MRRLLALVVIFAGSLGFAFGDDPLAKKLAMLPGIPCETITGFEDYEPMKDAVLTKDDKLLVYYRPMEFQHELVGTEYQVHLVQDARIHKRGVKAVLQAKDKIVDYKGKFKGLPISLFLSNTVNLKQLPPGEYDLEIILHDEIGKGPAATQIVPFRIRAAGAK